MADLPPAVRDLARRLGASEASPALVRFRQRGRMRQPDQARWMRFTAHHTAWTGHCGFDWRARMGPFGLVHVRDALVDGRGILDARLLGLISLASARGPEATRGEVMRYLAEIAWYPDAILANRALQWEVLGERRIGLAAEIGGIAAAIELALDDAGRIAAITAPDRPFASDGGFRPMPWWGQFSDYREHAGRVIPFAGEVGWVIDGERVSCWQGEVLDWEMVANDTAGSESKVGKM